MTDIQICNKCGAYLPRKSNRKVLICKDCRRRNKRLERKSKIIKCGIDGCDETLTSGSNRKYCYLHKGMTPGQRKVESKKLLKKKGLEN